MNERRLHRRNCHLHMLKRAREHGLDLTVMEIFRMERRVERLRPAFELAGQHRYRVVIVIARRRWRFVYDTSLRCFVTLLEGGPVYAPPSTARSNELADVRP